MVSDVIDRTTKLQVKVHFSALSERKAANEVNLLIAEAPYLQRCPMTFHIDIWKCALQARHLPFDQADQTIVQPHQALAGFGLVGCAGIERRDGHVDIAAHESLGDLPAALAVTGCLG